MPGRWRVAEAQRTSASVSISGDDLDPDDISALMGCAASRAERRGQVLFVRGEGQPPRVAHRGLWRLQADESRPGDLEAQIWQLLDALPQDPGLWRDLAARFRVSLFCGVFMDFWNVGVILSPGAMLALAERGIRLDLDIYAPPEGQDGVEAAGNGA